LIDPVVTVSDQNQAQRNPVASKPAMFTHMGRGSPPMITEIPVISRSRWISAMIPKTVPATRKAKVFDFIITGFLKTE